jgi:hypothetical protein
MRRGVRLQRPQADLRHLITVPGRDVALTDAAERLPDAAEQHAIGRLAAGKEVDAGGAVHVVLQEGAPGLRWRLVPVRHVLGDRGLGDGDTELEQLAVDSRRAPAGVL